MLALIVISASLAAADTALVPVGEGARAIEPEVRRFVAGVAGVALQKSANTLDDLEVAADGGLVCTAADEQCLLKLAALMRVQRVITISAQPSEAGVRGELTLIDVDAGRRTAVAPFTFAPGDAAALEEAVHMLLEPDRYLGVIVVTATPSGARVLIDGAASAVAAPRAEVQVKAGPHRVEVQREGYESHIVDVDVTAGAATPLAVTLQPAIAPAPEATLSLPLMLVAGGGTVLVGAGATALVIDGLLLGTDVGDFRSRPALLTIERVAAAIAAVGGAVAAAGGVMFFVSTEEP